MREQRNFWINPSEAIFFLSIGLFIVGTVNIFSASFVLSVEVFQDSYFFVKRHLLYFLLGFISMIFWAKIDYRRIGSVWQTLMLLTCILFLCATALSGVEINGAKRWLQIGHVKFQPSEFAKFIIIICTSFYLGRKVDRRQHVSLMSWPIAAAIIISVLVLIQPDMGTAIIIAGLCIFLYLFAGITKKQGIFLAISGIPLLLYLIYNASYRTERVMAWLDPWAYQKTSGYQAVQSLLAIGSGGFSGVGLGMGASKFHYLPEAHTDFAFAVLCQELGFIGALLVFILLGMLCWYGLQIALKAPDGYGSILALGLTALIVGQAIGNIAMISGILPITGVPLPFISFGGSSLIINMSAIGLLISIGRRTTLRVSPTPPLEDTSVPSGARPKLRLAKK